MPELPEVETTRRGIEPHVRGRRIERLVVRQPRLRWPIPTELAALLQGRSIERVERRGKYLLVPFAHGTLLMHLGMSGSLRIIDAGHPVGKHDHVDIELSSGQSLRYTDPRRFGAMLWYGGDISTHSLLADLGPEPLTADFDGDYLFERSRGRSAPVKTFLMDSHIVVGVGNIYANEALFSAGIRPDRAAGRISRARYAALADEVKRVLARSIEQGGTTLRDFVGGDGKPGYFRQQLNVYGRGGEPCRACKTILKEIRLGQRSTVFCVSCQK
ncbi:MAG TPA: bifunctional DNA-formamidopyrimidine glycosylase/DNA-(apurinic or apyrimidinic site) lyase [Spongiibacteraceae bacterium]|nr:bifunctional DNA-formamidopyrimidine glycosylase/DNA-(apurinic or apyrimidinic site) lyase [Spongiibacteraceae bacterium]